MIAIINDHSYKRQRTRQKYDASYYNHAISLDDLQDVVEIAKRGLIPNASFSDDECAAWSIVRQMLY